MMKEISTKSGFCATVDLDRLDNVELLDALAELSENGLGIGKVITLILGKEEKRRFYDHVRAENGAVPIKAVTDAFSEIMDLLSAKN